MPRQADDLLEQIKTFLDNLTEKEKAEINEMQFTATRRNPRADEPSICFSLVAAVPFKKGKARKLRTS